MQREARESVERITEEAVEMARRWEQFKTRYKNLLQNELERFENLSKDFMSEGDAHRVRFYSDTLPGVQMDGETALSPDTESDFTAGADFDAGRTIHTPRRNGR
jgi:hypothetical protein